MRGRIACLGKRGRDDGMLSADRRDGTLAASGLRAELDERQGRIVELRFFAGLSTLYGLLLALAWLAMSGKWG